MNPEATEAADALQAWGGSAPPRLVKARENAVFAVTLASGARAALRLHRSGYQSRAAIRSELEWTRALHLAGQPVPCPIATKAGDMVHQLSSGRLASVVSWVDGVPLGEAWQPLAGSPEVQARRFRAIGKMIAGLHAATDRLSFDAGFIRPAWDAEGLLGASPFWGRFWENPALSRSERGFLLDVRAAARTTLDDFFRQGADFGMIHADLMRENLLFDGDRVNLIDFDDSGFGFRLYDLGTLMVQNLDEPAYPDLLAAAVAGYRATRPLSDAAAAMVPFFVMLRAFASCGWAIPRLPEGDPRLRSYAARALRMAEAFTRCP